MVKVKVGHRHHKKDWIDVFQWSTHVLQKYLWDSACLISLDDEMRNAYRILLRKSDWKTLLGGLRQKWWATIKSVLRKQGVRVCTDFIWLKIGATVRICERSNETFDVMKGGVG